MPLQLIKGGVELTPEDQLLVNKQKSITREVNLSFIQVGATFLKPASKHPIKEDWYNRVRGETDLQAWIDDPEQAVLNVGFNMQFGWMDVDIDADDPEYNRCIISAMDFLGSDTRFRFGRRSKGIPTHIFVQLPEEESGNFDELRKFAPKECRIDGKRLAVELRSFPTDTSAKNLAGTAKQVVVPGSIYLPKSGGGDPKYDISVWYRPTDGRPATHVNDLATTTPRRTSYSDLIRSVAFGTIYYIMQHHWMEGTRQITAIKFAGWLTRVVKDSFSMMEHHQVAQDVFCPVADDTTAERLIRFICQMMEDNEPGMRVRAYYDAKEKLERNPDAKIPGWHSMTELVGAECMQAMRTVLTPGSDVSKLTVMAERYIYDETDNHYIDRNRHKMYGRYVHEGAELERRHKGDTIFIGGKPREAFKVFESSTMRKRVGVREMYPDLDAGGIFRVDVMGNPIPDESDTPSTTIFNSWQGWKIDPIEEIDDSVMEECVKTLDELLGYLTRNDANQIKWMKEWIAWTFQHPGDKQQIAPVIVGGMGVGKSFFGNVFLKSVFTDRLWGSANPKILEGTFTIGPFKDKMVVFIDEAKFHGELGTDEIKKLIRNVEISGMEKFEEARNFRIFARIVFASNKFNMNIGQRDVRDRALFYMRTYDQEFMNMNEIKFREWALTLKPFFDKFGIMLKQEDVLRHYVRYFMELPCDRHTIEDIRYSSSNDPDIVASNVSWARRIATSILESGWLASSDLSIDSPFDVSNLNSRVIDECKSQGLPHISGQSVLREYTESGIVDRIVEDGKRYFRFKQRWADTIATFEAATGLHLNAYREFVEDDKGENTTTMKEHKRRVGSRAPLGGKI